MKNIPLFTTNSGIASLILEQIAFNQTAYVRIQSSDDPAGFIRECIDFCRAVGAVRIFAAGDMIPNEYVFSGSVVRMSRDRSGLQSSTASLVSVTRENIDNFRQIYNQRMYSIPNASSLSILKAQQLISDASGYFVYQCGELIGIGIAKGEWVHAVVSMKRGMGETVMLALNSILHGEKIHVELIDSNLPAKSLYDRMGFLTYETVSRWYQIF